jgi:hypothetical protein
VRTFPLRNLLQTTEKSPAVMIRQNVALLVGDLGGTVEIAGPLPDASRIFENG